MLQRSMAALVVVIAVWLAAAGVASADRVILTPQGSTNRSIASFEYLSAGRAYRANVELGKNVELEYAGFHDFGPKDSHAISVQCALGTCLSIGVSDLEDKTAGVGSLYGGRAYYLAAAVPVAGIETKGDLTGIVMLDCGIGSGSLKGIFAGTTVDLANHMRISAEYDTHNVNYGISYLYPVGPSLGTVSLNSIKGSVYLGFSLAMPTGL